MENTDLPLHIIKMAIAHKVENDQDSAYTRTQLEDKRRGLMAAWSDYITEKGGE